MDMIMLKIDNISKQYRLGQISGTTLREELQRLGAKILHKEDPTRKIGAPEYTQGETFYALDKVSFEVKRGERIGIIGRNGAGKSTLLKLISRITAPTSGDIWLNGRVASMLEVGTGFHRELTGRENIYMNGAILGMRKKEIDSKIEDIIDFSECRQFIDTPVKRYSSGMYVKLAFSVAAHLDSEIMIMDEVLAVGDMAFQKKCLEKMNNVSKEEGRTILYVSHNMNTIRQLCNRCIVLDHGRILYDGEPEEAISTYMGIQSNASNRINLRELKRDPEFSTHPVTMTCLECLGTEKSVFEVGSCIDLQLDCISSREIREAYVRIVIKSPDGRPVTMMTTNRGVPLSASKEKHLRLTLDVGALVPGRYTISPVVYEVNDLGSNVNLDGVKEVFCFDIVPVPGFNNNMIWQPRYWGYCYSRPITIKEECMESMESCMDDA
ncbi:MAG: polysaccharide ABC transporter ATP-binding protein, partial [Oscillospiraceae bacterium]|nr:polysaccharide ABC transporter ATP-binding protein [Oscillospiraceae bacterium]